MQFKLFNIYEDDFSWSTANIEKFLESDYNKFAEACDFHRIVPSYLACFAVPWQESKIICWKSIFMEILTPNIWNEQCFNI